MSKKYLNMRPIAQMLNSITYATPVYKTSIFVFDAKICFESSRFSKIERGACPSEMVNTFLAYLIEYKRSDYQLKFTNHRIFVYLIRDKKTEVITTAEGIEAIYYKDSFQNQTIQYRYYSDVRFRLLKIPKAAVTEQFIDETNHFAWIVNPERHDKKPFGYNFYHSKNKK